MMKVLAVVATLAVSAMMASSCGYALAGRGSTLPDHIRRIGVPTFDNQSNTPDLDRVLSEAVRREFQSRGKFIIVEETTGVDAVLTGTVRPVLMTVSALTDARQASRYLITIQASVEFKDLKDNKVLWANPGLRTSDEYEVTGNLNINDPTALFSQDANALERMARAFARNLVASILEAF